MNSIKLLDKPYLRVWLGADARQWSLPVSVTYAHKCLIVRILVVRFTIDWGR
jgi:hypothetical protein